MTAFKTWGEQITETVQQASVKVPSSFELRHTPMAVRIRKLLNAMPEADRLLARPLQFFINALAPKYSGKRAAAREVAAGLVELGFTKKRVWVSSNESYCAVWFPKEKQHD